MTRPDNAEQTKAAPVLDDEPAAGDAPANGAATSAPRQRQGSAPGDPDPKTVSLQVGAPEHARGAVRDQADRQPEGGRAYGFSRGVGPPVVDNATRRVPSSSGSGSRDHSGGTVRVGGYTPPERVEPAAPSGQSRSVRVPRQTSLQLRRLDPWSVLKISLVLSCCGFLVWLVAVGVLYGVLAGMGVWDQINGTYSDLTSVNNPQVTELVSGGRVFGAAFVIGLVNIVLMTALATVGSLVYNVAADFVGGIEVTLSEPD
ncbi:MAG TPA: DUF3566 domain-containing protein [Pseudonocardiaceae bacterium]|nr:DUF3566 domain-containing protein [Pseudonocardiaceae bacterium]